ncbi:MAG: TVP38/TMEM64 family protein [Cetobacterium sp.]|uniref:TVP38/TMEM64 family protein n=1 Tax=Cetobacterium sp. TaxID=2071632 RepID=UPI003F311F83
MLNNKKIIKRVILLLFLLMILFGLKESNVLEYLKDRKNLEELIKSLGVWGPISYIGLYAVITITCVSTLPLTLAGGIIFGPIIGIIYTVIGACLGLSLSFLIARYLLKSPIEKKFGNTEIFKKINEGVKNEGWFILATTRLLPVFPFGIQNYVYGLTSINFIKYSLLSTLFILPGTSVFVLLAGAVASGNIKTAIKISIIASMIFFLLIVLTKIVAKKENK